MAVIANIRVGKPDVDPDKPSHIKGVRQGNERGNYAKEKGLLPDGKATSRRSTSINAKAKNPIDPRMPTLTPA